MEDEVTKCFSTEGNYHWGTSFLLEWSICNMSTRVDICYISACVSFATCIHYTEFLSENLFVTLLFNVMIPRSEEGELLFLN